MPPLSFPCRVTAGALAAVFVAATATAGGLLPARPAAAAPDTPGTFRFQGSGYGHGVGMSQYGALGMTLRGRTAADIIGFYYGGARPVTVTLPSSIRVGLLEARPDGVVVRATPVPGSSPDAPLWFRTRDRTGRPVARALPRRTTLTLRPDAGGVSVFEGGLRRFGPSAPGSAVRVDYHDGVTEPSLLTLPQARRTLRWGYLDVSPVHDGQRPRLRAVATMTWRHYLRGVAEIPGDWPAEAQRAQAIAARSYALAVVRAAGQRRGADHWHGCDCAVRPDSRDQHYEGWTHERAAPAWTAAVDATDQKVVAHGAALVKALYHASSGGHTAAASTVFGGADQPYYPSKPDPWDDADGRNPNVRWTQEHSAAAVSQTLADLGVGQVTRIRVVSVDASGRVGQAEVSGTGGRVRIAGTRLRAALKLRSTKFRVTAIT